MMRQIILYTGEDGYWVAECPSLPGCVSQGKSKEQAIENIKEAIIGYVAALQEDKLPVFDAFDSLLASNLEEITNHAVAAKMAPPKKDPMVIPNTLSR